MSIILSLALTIIVITISSIHEKVVELTELERKKKRLEELRGYLIEKGFYKEDEQS